MADMIINHVSFSPQFRDWPADGTGIAVRRAVPHLRHAFPAALGQRQLRKCHERETDHGDIACETTEKDQVTRDQDVIGFEILQGL
jgi:hypothetical protein